MTFTSETKLIIVNVSVKDKMGNPVPNLKKEDFEITEDGRSRTSRSSSSRSSPTICYPPMTRPGNGPKQLEERVEKPSRPRRQARGSRPLRSPAAWQFAAQGRRLMAMFFDMTTMPQFDQIRAHENAIKFVQEQMTSSDLVQIMKYGNKLNVVEEFTDDRELLLITDLKPWWSDEGSELAGGAATGGAEGDDSGGFTQDDTEFNIFNTDRQLAAIEDAVKKLAAFPEKKAMMYFSSGIPKNGIDNQSQLRAATNAAARANVSIYPWTPAAWGFGAGRRRDQRLAKGTGAQSGTAHSGRIASQQDTQETIATLAADTGGKACSITTI